MLAWLFAAHLVSVTGDTPVQPPQSDCTGVMRQFRHKTDLPPQIVNQVEQITKMADVDEPFQLTDVIVGDVRDALPFYRFKSGQQFGCTLDVQYESGGRGHGYGWIQFVKVGDDWTVREATYPFIRLKPGFKLP